MKRTTFPNKRRTAIEFLEARRLLAVVAGTAGDDTISISASGGSTHIIVNGNDTTTGDSSIVLNCGNGNDNITVQSTRSGTSIEVYGEGGSDTLGNGPSDLDAVFLANVLFDGGDGIHDDVVANNLTDSTSPALIDIGNNGIVKNNAAFLMRYAHIEQLVYYDSNASNRIGFINLQGSTYDITDVTIKGNGGNDTFANTSSNFPNAGFWPTSIGTGGIRLDGGAGSDTVQLNNASDTGGVYLVGADVVDVDTPSSNAGALTYVGCESFDFFTSDRNDFVILAGEAAGTTLRFDSGGGDDSFFASSGDIDSQGFVFANTTLTGGAGNDSIKFDDHLDKDAAGETESYALGVFTLAKGTAGFNYNSFESQTLDVSDAINVGQLNTVPVVNINALSGELNSTTINGGANKGCIVNVTTGNLVNLSGTLTLALQGGTVNVNDQNSAGATSSYEVNNTQVRKASTAQTINYSGVTTMTLNCGAVADQIEVKSTPVGMALTINGNGGNETMFFGNGNVDANVLGPVTFNGGAGFDALGIDNRLDTTLESMTLNASSLIDSGVTYGFSGLEGTMNVDLGPGGTNLTINGTTVNTNINGDVGDETLTIGGGDIDANLAATIGKSLFIDAKGGHNTLRINDLNDTNIDLYIFKQTSGGLDQFDKRDGANEYFVTWSGVEAVTLDGSNALSGSSASTFLVTSIATPLRINGNAGPDSVQVADSFSPVTVNTGLGDVDSISVNSDFDAIAATVVIDQIDDVENLAIFNGGTVRVMSGAVLAATRNFLNPAVTIDGVLDLAGGAFLSRAGGPTPASLRAKILTGQNGGAWNGTGGSAGAINSSLAASSALPDAVGYGQGSEIAPTTIGPFNVAAGDTLLRYTYYGDSDLNGVVDFDDYSRIDNGFGNGRTGWVNGDYDYNNVINFDDYSLIDLAFNTQGSPLGSPLRAQSSWNERHPSGNR